jgi:uncharacterized protein (DUF1778 family)
MKDSKRTKTIAFRVTDEDYARIEKAATAIGDDNNSWCRNAVLSQLSEANTFTNNERLIYQEIALLRYLLGHGFKLLFSGNESTAATWKKLTIQADQISDEIRDLHESREVKIPFGAVAWGFNSIELLKRNCPDELFASIDEILLQLTSYEHR